MQDKPLSTEELIAQDVGGRSPAGAMAGIIAGLALLWSLFQLWIASPLPFVFGFGVFNDTETRAIHLAFALLLAFLAYPAFRRSPRDRVPLADIALGLAPRPAPPTCSSPTSSWRNARATSPPSTWSPPASASRCCWRPRAAPSARRWR